MKLIIQGGLVCVNNNKEPTRADILIRDNRIIHIKKDIRSLNARRINAQGSYVIPGLIDSNGTLDTRYFPNRSAIKDFYREQGITTVLLGLNGLSYAPILGNAADHLEKTRMTNMSHISWKSIKSMSSAINKLRLPVNIATFVCYHLLRTGFTQSKSHPLTDKEAEAVQIMLDRSITEGALGISLKTSRILDDCISSEEIKNIIRTCQKANCVLALQIGFSSTNDQQILHSLIRRVLNSEIKTIFHLEYIPFATINRDLLMLLHAALNKPHCRISINSSKNILLRANDFLPLSMTDKNLMPKKNLLQHLNRLPLHELSVAFAPEPYHYLEGKSLKTISQNMGLKGSDALSDILKKFNTQGMFKVSNTDYRKLLSLEQKHYLIGTGDSFSLFTSETHSKTESHKNFLELILRENTHGTPQAISQLSNATADFFGIKERGNIKVGNIADCVVIKNKTITTSLVNGSEDGIFIGRK